jgi:hypothetical protein
MVGVGVELTNPLVAVIVAAPAPTAVTVVVPVVPEAGLTDKTALLLELHETVRPVRVLLFASFRVAVSTCVPPNAINVVVGAETVTVATLTGLTVIVGVGLELTPSAPLVAVIVAVPGPTAVNVTGVPLGPESGLTVSTPVLLESHPTVRPVRVFPLPSFVVAVSCCVPPTTIGVVGAETVTAATGTGLTVMTGVARLATVSLDAVIVAVPSPAALIVTVAPLAVLTEVAALTVSTAVLLEAQFTVRPDRSVPLASFGFAVRT